jgi:hypothetical protein
METTSKFSLTLTQMTSDISQSGSTSYVSWTVKNRNNSGSGEACPETGNATQVYDAWHPNNFNPGGFLGANSEYPSDGNWIVRSN